MVQFRCIEYYYNVNYIILYYYIQLRNNEKNSDILMVSAAESVDINS